MVYPLILINKEDTSRAKTRFLFPGLDLLLQFVFDLFDAVHLLLQLNQKGQQLVFSQSFGDTCFESRKLPTNGGIVMSLCSVLQLVDDLLLHLLVLGQHPNLPLDGFLQFSIINSLQQVPITLDDSIQLSLDLSHFSVALLHFGVNVFELLVDRQNRVVGCPHLLHVHQ